MENNSKDSTHESQARDKPKTKALYKRKLVEIKNRIEGEFCNKAQKGLNNEKKNAARRKAIVKHKDQKRLNKIKYDAIYFLDYENPNLLKNYKNEIHQLKIGIVEITNHNFYCSIYTVGLQLLLFLTSKGKPENIAQKISELELLILLDTNERIYIGINEVGPRTESVSLLMEFAMLVANETYNRNIDSA